LAREESALRIRTNGREQEPAAAREPAEPVDLGYGVLHFQSPLWQTNSLVAVASGEALVCDPAYTPAEIEAIRSAVQARASSVRLLITHADFDHVCGIGYFPTGEVVAGADTARILESGTAAEGLRTQGPEWGVRWPDTLRVDRVVPAPAELELGVFRVATIDAPSHGREGTAYVLLEQGILVPGDHLSSITYPFLGGSLERKRQANVRLIQALDQHDLRWVVPGHGPPMSPQEARHIGELDLAYLEQLATAAQEALSEGLSPGYALLHAHSVEPPRTTTPDFEIYDLRSSNARQALGEAASE
jgi:glyoxylase-like metal-dependent hydrolase (beta-lactamase superfamily II)